MSLDSKSRQLYDTKGKPMASIDPSVECTLMNVSGRRCLRKFGFNQNVSSAAEETVWEPGGIIVLMSSAEIVNFVSSSASDAVGQIGAITLKITGILNDWSEQTETITLTGITPVATVNEFRFINRVRVSSAGSSRVNIGRIEATASVSANVLASIPIGYSVTQQTVFAVPLGKVAIIERFELTAAKLAGGAKPLVTGRIHEHQFLGEFAGTSTVVFEETFDTAVVNVTTDQSLKDEVIPAGTIVEMAVSTDTNVTGVFGRFEYMLIDELQSRA